MSRVACSFLVAAALANAQGPGRGCDMNQVFADMHDGDEKEVTIKGKEMTIKPHGGGQDWVVNAEIDCSRGKAIVDFNVPGKDDHPPVPLTATLFTSLSPGRSGQRKTSFVFTDPSGTLVDDATFPLNQWVAEESSQANRHPHCPRKLHAVFADMHDGDRKEVTIDGGAMTIKPSGNDQEWTVEAALDVKSCTAVVDFNVPGKSDFPPVNLTASFWLEHVNRHRPQNAFEFTDPSGTLADADFPLNRWIQVAKAATLV